GDRLNQHEHKAVGLVRMPHPAHMHIAIVPQMNRLHSAEAAIKLSARCRIGHHQSDVIDTLNLHLSSSDGYVVVDRTCSFSNFEWVSEGTRNILFCRINRSKNLHLFGQMHGNDG